MRLKFFQSSSSSSSSNNNNNNNKGGATALDDASFISSSSGTSQSSWHQQQQRAATEPRRGKSPYYQQQDQQLPNRPKTLNTVMQLFDHDQQSSVKRNLNSTTTASIQNTNNNVSSTDNPYRVKANGAVVINRTTAPMADNDDLLLGNNANTSGIGLSSHISTSSSVEASTTTNPSISQPITTLPFFEPDEFPNIHNATSSSSSSSNSDNINNKDIEQTTTTFSLSPTSSSIPKSIHPSPTTTKQSTKMRMESNSSRSTFPIHDTTRFSIDGDSLCSMESWTSSMIMEPMEENNNNHRLSNDPYLSNEQNQHHHQHHHHHVTALSPPPRNTTKKWEKGRVYSSDVDDICEALTTISDSSKQQQQQQSLLSPPSAPPPSSSSSSSSSQQKQQQYHHYEQDNNWQTMFELANQENVRLRHQLECEQKEHDKINKHQIEILVNTRRENKYLKSALSRIRSLSNTDAAYNKEKRRRQSTGEITMLFSPLGEGKGQEATSSSSSRSAEPTMTLSNRTFHGSSVTLTYERKIKILLDEIEGMQAEEEMMYTRRSKLATKNTMLERQLLAREESIKQLEHDLRIMRLQM